MDITKFFDFLVKQEGKAYDTKQAIKSALDALDDVPFLRGTTYNREDFSKLDFRLSRSLKKVVFP